MARKLQVEVIGDASSLQKAFGKAGGESSKLGKSLQSLGKIAAVGVGAAFAGLAATLKVGFDELGEGQKVAAQTGAVLKSTGGAANVTAKQIEGLAGSLSRMSGVDDEAIQSGQNLLLTFTNLRNEAGKGNDIFNQATRTMLDMSVALGTEASGSAIQLGKSLNDPIKGITALTRVGVSFTQGQKDSIAAMVEAGNTMGAQKLILAELRKEFGGSAEAAGSTLPGQLSKLRNAFEEAAASVASTLLPHLTSLLSWVNAHMPQIQAVIQTAVDGISKAFEGIAAAVDVAMGPLGTFKTFLEENPEKAKIMAGAILGVAAALGIATVAQIGLNLAVLANPYVAATVAVGALAGALVALYLTNERVKRSVNAFFADLRKDTQTGLEFARAAWDRFGTAITSIAKAAFLIVTSIAKAAFLTVTLGFRNMVDGLRGTFNVFAGLFTGDWSRLWTGLKQIFNAFLGNLVGVVRAQVTAVYEGAKAIGRAFVDGIKAGLAALGAALTSAVKAPLNAVIRAWNALGVPGFNLSINLPRPLPDINFGWGGISLPDIPQLAKGVKNFAGGLAVVGERGPELVGLPRGSNVIPHGGMAMAGAGGATTIVHVHVAGSVITERDLALSVRDALVSRGLRNGGGMFGGQG